MKIRDALAKTYTVSVLVMVVSVGVAFVAGALVF